MSSIHRKTRHTALLTVTVLVVMCFLGTGAAAAERETLYNADYCFSAGDFALEGAELQGIFITDVPSAMVGRVQYGSRVIRAGDVLPASALEALILSPTCRDNRQAEVGYLPITAEGLGEAMAVQVSIFSGKNAAPTASDSALETYKNIANTGTLEVSDPEGEALRYSLTSAPRRGSVELSDDGTYTYTPAKNKVGRDSFTFTATDPAGNVSNEATVSIEIIKPIDRLTYGDMAGDPDCFAAMWLHNSGLLTGETVAGVACFSPDKPVTRGEFLVMVSQLCGLKPDDAQLTSGFADEGETPQWMRPYIVAALRTGVVSGVNSNHGLVFRPGANLTTAEAAVMLQNVLRLPEAKEAAGFAGDEAVPTWAAGAMEALFGAGVPVQGADSMTTVTRRTAARLLYAAAQLQEESKNELLF